LLSRETVLTELVTREQALAWSLEEWSQQFHEVYKKRDKDRHYSGIWLHVLNHASKVAEQVRLNQQEYVLFHLGNAFVWICAFAHRVSQDIRIAENARKGLLKQIGASYTTWILRKYPLLCHTCGCSPCICSTRRDVAELRSSSEAWKKKYEDTFGKPRDAYLLKQAESLRGKMNDLERQSLPELMSSFMDTYSGTLWGTPNSDVCFHFLEEIGEASVEIGSLEDKFRYYNADKWKTECSEIDWSGNDGQTYEDLMFGLTRELADVFSWTCGLLYKCHQQWQVENIPPHEYLVRLYLGDLRDQMKKIRNDADKRGRLYTKEVPLKQRIMVVCAWCQEPECKDDCAVERVATRSKKIHDHREERCAYEKQMIE
jgi:hypothetical protein